MHELATRASSRNLHNGVSHVRLDVPAVKNALADPATVTRALGLESGAKRQAGGYLVRCPAHADRTPSCSLTRGPDGTLRVRCFGCGLAGDILVLVAAVEGLDHRRDFAAVMERAAALAGIDATAHSRATRLPAPPPPPPKPPPPAAEVRALWEACGPTSADSVVASWLRSRMIDPAIVDVLGLARALPDGAEVPRWATYRGDSPASRPWSVLGYRCLVPLYDEAGVLRSLRARYVGSARADSPKTLPPTGHGSSGLVMACPLGAMMLALAAWPWWAERRLYVAEGETDFLTLATRGTVPRTSVVLGVTAGAWGDEIATRVPAGTTVVIGTDQDDAGDRYAEHVAASLRGKCRVLESYPEDRAERRRTRREREAARRRDDMQITMPAVRP